MMYLLIVSAALAPALFFVWYFYRVDIYEPEPKLKVIKMFFLGCASTVAATGVHYLLWGIPFFRYAWTGAPLIEETMKFLFCFFFIFKDAEFDEPVDGLVYSSAAALGFAAVENILYCYNAFNNDQLLEVAAVRALLSVPAHALSSGFWGYAMGVAKFINRKKIIILSAGVVLSITSHGLFNFFASGNYIMFLLLILLVLVLWKVIRWLTRDLLDISPFKNKA